MRIRAVSLAACAVAVVASAVRADDSKRAKTAPPSDTILFEPEAPDPVLVRRTARVRVTPDGRTPGTAAGDLDGLRATALKEGEAQVQLAGVSRRVRVGDLLGSGTVRAIGTDRIVLEKAFSVAGGTPSRATVVVTFGPGGVPRVRTFVDATALPPPPAFPEAR